MKLAYLAQGRLFYRENGSSKLIESQFGQEVINRALARQAKNEWKSGGGEQALYSRQSLWGVQGADPRAIHVRITALSAGEAEKELCYVVSTDSIGGLFNYNLETERETRVFHKEGLYLSDFARQPGEKLIACCRRFGNGTAGIAVLDGQDLNEITEGDSVDESPSWIPGTKQLVYQSAGVARNQHGYMMGVGPAHIQKIDLDTGSLETMLEEDGYDLLCPRMTKEKDLLFIRRPYETPFGRSLSPAKVVADILLFPFRLARAIFDFLNVFSLIFSKKPLTSAAGPKLDGPDEKTLFLRGRIIDAEKALQEKTNKDEIPSLVPKSWQLVRRKRNGEQEILADAVLSFDLAADGTIVYSTGTAAYRLENGSGRRELLFKDKLIETIMVLD